MLSRLWRTDEVANPRARMAASAGLAVNASLGMMSDGYGNLSTNKPLATASPVYKPRSGEKCPHVRHLFPNHPAYSAARVSPRSPALICFIYGAPPLLVGHRVPCIPPRLSPQWTPPSSSPPTQTTSSPSYAASLPGPHSSPPSLNPTPHRHIHLNLPLHPPIQHPHTPTHHPIPCPRPWRASVSRALPGKGYTLCDELGVAAESL